jgi:hypothetical protein
MYSAFVLVSEAASLSTLLCLLLAYLMPREYRTKWLKLAVPLFLIGFIVYDMWNQSSAILQGASVFLSVIILSFCMLISFKLAHILGLSKARALPRRSHARGKFDPRAALSISNRAVKYASEVAIPAILPLVLLPFSLAAPVGIAGLITLLFTVFWRIGSQTPASALDVKFRRDLRCLLILCLMICSLLSIYLFWWIFGVLTIGLEAALVICSAFCVCLVFVLLRLLGISRQFEGGSQDAHRRAFMSAYWEFEKSVAFCLFVFLVVFSDVPAIMLVNSSQGTTFVLIWLAGVIGCLVALARSYTFERTSLMFENNWVSRVDVTASIDRLAGSYLS